MRETENIVDLATCGNVKSFLQKTEQIEFVENCKKRKVMKYEILAITYCRFFLNLFKLNLWFRKRHHHRQCAQYEEKNRFVIDWSWIWKMLFANTSEKRLKVWKSHLVTTNKYQNWIPIISVGNLSCSMFNLMGNNK